MIDNVYLETGVDKSPSSFETVFFRKDITFLAARKYSDEICELVIAMVTESDGSCGISSGYYMIGS